ncbi:hypothetical protein [Flavobacterium sp. N3904]|uniref:hypothetical protein n=1 Tax=Flavobacterium sp. N3904 TaxID=2986835 RepID=UPI002224C5BD|nr:hypothetical protein [Flavobacterium sp. N3904]
MNTSKIIGIILIVVSLAIGYMGINKISGSTKKVNLLGLKIDASNESGQQQGYIYVGVAIVIFIGGIYSAKSKS